MNGGTKPSGYTIIEVLIVLAVSGIMFLIAANFISGKQAKTAFTQGSNEFMARTQEIIAQVKDGQFSDVNFGCTVSAGVATITATPAGVSTQGSNSACVFTGKAIVLSHDSTGPVADKTKYAVFSLASARTDTPPAFIATPIMDTGASPPLDLTAYLSTPQNLDAQSLTATDTGGTVHANVAALIVAQSQTASATSAQTTGLYYSDTAPANGVSITLLPATSGSICVNDGARYALITLGSASGVSQLTVNRQVVPTC